jgi:hypothetical protein
LCCSVAMYLRLCEGTTRSSWSAVSSNTAGYPDEPAESCILWRGDIFLKLLHSVSLSAHP